MASGGDHFFTISKAERDAAAKAGWRPERVECTVLTPTVRISQVPGGEVTAVTYVLPPFPHATMLWRLYHDRTVDHFMTASADEAASLAAQGWRNEGVGAVAFTRMMNFASWFCHCTYCKTVIRTYDGRPIPSSLCPSRPGQPHAPRDNQPYTVATALHGFDGEPGFQAGWSQCARCAALFFAQTPGRCTAYAGPHVPDGAASFILCDGQPGRDGQDRFSWCSKCGVLWRSRQGPHRPDPPFGRDKSEVCPAGGKHSKEGSGLYTLHCYAPELDNATALPLTQLYKGGRDTDHSYVLPDDVANHVAAGYAYERVVAYALPREISPPIGDRLDANTAGLPTPFYRLYLPVKDDPGWLEKALNDIGGWIKGIELKDVLTGTLYVGLAAFVLVFGGKAARSGVKHCPGPDGSVTLVPGADPCP